MVWSSLCLPLWFNILISSILNLPWYYIYFRRPLKSVKWVSLQSPLWIPTSKYASVHSVKLTLYFTSAICVQLQLIFTFSFSYSLYTNSHSMFWPNWPSTGIQVLCLRELLFCFPIVIAIGRWLKRNKKSDLRSATECCFVVLQTIKAFKNCAVSYARLVCEQLHHRTNISLLLLHIITAMKLTCKDSHPTKLLKQASLTLLRTVTICCGINADHVQPSSTRILCSLLRDIIQVSNLCLCSEFNGQDSFLPDLNVSEFYLCFTPIYKLNLLLLYFPCWFLCWEEGWNVKS
jgi:hypothetical protein